MTNHSQSPTPVRTEIESWLARWIAQDVGMPVEEIDPSHSLLQYSLSSVTATILVGDLEDWLGLRLPPTLVWDFPSIDAMTEHLLTKLQENRTAGLTAPATAQGSPGRRDLSAGDSVDPGKLLTDLDSLSDQEVAALLNQLMEEDGVGAQVGTTGV